MNKAERAALTALLDNVGLGFTKCLAETKLLREFLRRTQPRLTVNFCTYAEKPQKTPVRKAKAMR